MLIPECRGAARLRDVLAASAFRGIACDAFLFQFQKDMDVMNHQENSERKIATEDFLRGLELPDSPKAAPRKIEYAVSHEEWLKQDLFERLSRSNFRMRFHLRAADKAYIKEHGMDLIRQHAADIIRKRLAPAEPLHDGKQTPMRGAPHGHPVFLAQHATATCCRGCLEKWHGIPQGRAMTKEEQERVTDVIMEWIRREMVQ